MFDKLLFNRNAFDRDVSSAAISSNITASGSIKINLVLQSPITVRPMAGISRMTCGIIMRQHMEFHVNGGGIMAIENLILGMKINPIRLSGSGHIQPFFHVRTPFKGNFTGSGTMKLDNRFLLLQFMDINIGGTGKMSMDFIMHSAIPVNLEGWSDLNGSVSLWLPIGMNIQGQGELMLRRLSALNENILELDGINLLPGESVTIDTDLLQVLFGAKEDVSSVTNDSIFFELNPGENEVTISVDSDTLLDVVAIWQNRWL